MLALTNWSANKLAFNDDQSELIKFILFKIIAIFSFKNGE